MQESYMENWKDIPGWEEYYEVSDLGNVRSKVRKLKNNIAIRSYGGKEVKSFLKPNGYMFVNLTTSNLRKQVSVHTLVLTAFIGERPKDYDACHYNGIRTDNRLINLRWDTRKSNHADRIRYLNVSKQKAARNC